MMDQTIAFKQAVATMENLREAAKTDPQAAQDLENMQHLQTALFVDLRKYKPITLG
jgi:hypothetical protein